MEQKNSQNADMRSLSPVLSDYGARIESHHHGPDFSTGMHAHKYASLIYIVSGQGKCITEVNEYELFANTAIMLTKGRSHQLVDKPRKAMVVFVLYFSEKSAGLSKQIIQPLFDSCFLTVPLHDARPIRRILRRMLHEQNTRPSQYQFAVKQCLGDIMLNLYRSSIDRDQENDIYAANTSLKRASAVLDHIESHYYEHHSQAEAAMSAHLSQRQFTNICRKLKGKSFVQFLNTLRIQKAKDLLKKTDMPVSAIAFEVGFEELSTFYRAFKKHVSLSPLDLRKTPVLPDTR